ncbi:MAG: hypothetical protein ACKOPT_01750 [Cyanobium sp.]
MPRLNKGWLHPQAGSLVMATLAVSLTTGAFFPPRSHGMPLAVDRQCLAANSTDSNYQVDHSYRLRVASGEQPYWLVLARYVDGSTIFCLMEGDAQRPWRLPIPELQDQFISDITQKNDSVNLFMVTVRHGNGWNVPLTSYHLDLRNPKSPVLVKIKESVERTR